VNPKLLWSSVYAPTGPSLHSLFGIRTALATHEEPKNGANALLISRLSVQTSHSRPATRIKGLPVSTG
jgi:hypothetical protein